MLSPAEIGRFYLDVPLNVPSLRNLSRKHFRISLGNGRFVKLNKFENRLAAKDSKFYCWKLKPRLHGYSEPLESPLEGPTGAVKPCAKNLAEAA